MSIVSITIQAIVYLLVQKFVLQELVIYDLAYAKLHLALVLFLPGRWPVAGGLLFAFCYGFAADLLLHPLGLNAFCCTLLFGARVVWLNLIANATRDPDEAIDLQQEAQSFGWLLSYLIPLIFVFEFFYGLLNNMGFSGHSLLEILFSTFYSSLVVVLVALLVFRKSP